MSRHKTAVIGLGNDLLRDEGTGVHAVRLLEKKLKGVDVDVIEARTCGMNLLHQLEERNKIIFIDAGNCGLKPGEYARFTPQEVKSNRQLDRHSLHEFDLITFLEFARKLYPRQTIEFVIYCMQVAEVSMSEALSEPAQRNLPNMIHDICREIEEEKKGTKFHYDGPSSRFG